MRFIRSWAPRLVCPLLLGAIACGGDSSGPEAKPPSSLVLVAGNTQTGSAGRNLTNPLVVRVNDSAGMPLSNVAVSFTILAGQGSVSLSTAQTGTDGTATTSWTLGQQAGAEQRVEASVSKPDGTTLSTVFTATAVAGAAVNIVKVSGDAQLGGAGSALRDSIVIRVTDEFGNGVPSVSIAWMPQAGTVSPTSSLTNSAGRAAARWTLGDNLGQFTATANATAITPASFTATVNMAITSISPAELVPGAAVTLTGAGFTAGTASNTLSIAGVPTAIQTATATMVTATVPANLPCAVGNVAVSLTSGGITTSRQHLARSAAPRAINAGEVLIGSTADPLTCLELPQGGGRYMITMTNTNASGAAASLRLRAAASSGAAATVAPAAARPVQQFLNPDLARALERRSHHMEMLERNNALFEQMQPRGQLQAALRAMPTAQQVVPNVGDTMSIRIPRLTASNLCASYDSVRARVVSVGTHGVALEDIANPLAGSIDSLYHKLVQEFDARQYDKVKDNFRDPLLLDATLDNNGRLLMIFSSRLNSYQVAGFVFLGDFFARNQCAQSNGAEIFYGYAPTVNNQEYAANSIGEWYWTIRPTVVHEVKHIAAYAERLSNGSLQDEEIWLEEGLAMIVEELWARDIFGYVQRGNTGYLQSVGCEIRGALPNVNWPLGPRPECTGRPGVTWIHLGYLANWLEVPSTRTMLCRTTTECPDANYYGTAWLFLRWLLDHSAQAEDALLRQLTQTTSSGVTNIQARFGRTFAELVPEWMLAIALDDRAGFTPPNASYTMPSWNMRDLYAGLNREQPTSYPDPYPLFVTMFSFGNAQFDVPTVRPGAAAFFELSGAPVGRQTLEVTGAGGAALPSGLRVTIARIQ